MSMAPLKFKLAEYSTPKNLKSYRDVQKSVNQVFGIFEEYLRLEKSLENLEK